MVVRYGNIGPSRLKGLRSRVSWPTVQDVLTERPQDLPDYERPPLVEVVMGVAYENVLNFSQAHVGLYWSKVRNELPQVQDQPRLDLPPLSGPEGMFQFQFGGGASHRSWFISDDSKTLLQLQDNLLLQNWRALETADVYPRHEALLADFSRRLSLLKETFVENALSPPRILQTELTYFNWVEASMVTSFLTEPTSLTMDVSGIHSALKPDAWQAKYEVISEGAAGQLTVDAHESARILDGEIRNGYQLVLTHRGSLLDDEILEVDPSRGLGRAREVIVRAFTALTKPEMHERWMRTQ